MAQSVVKPHNNAFLVDDDNSAKFAEHGLSERQIFQVLDNAPLAAPNRQARRGSYLVLGRDNGGQCIAIPIEATHEFDVWRPVTAWPCKANEEARLRLEER